jgi:hypothetical protein
MDENDENHFALAESELGAGIIYGEDDTKPSPVKLPETFPALSDDDDDLFMRDADRWCAEDDPDDGDSSQSDELEDDVDDFAGADTAPRPVGQLVHTATLPSTFSSPGTMRGHMPCRNYCLLLLLLLRQLSWQHLLQSHRLLNRTRTRRTWSAALKAC